MEKKQSFRGQLPQQVIYRRGILIPSNSLQKAYFILDSKLGVLHIFKIHGQDLDCEKIPEESLSLFHGRILDQTRVILDTSSDYGRILESFDFLLQDSSSNAIKFTVLSHNDDESIHDLQQAFQQCTILPQAAHPYPVVKLSRAFKSEDFLQATRLSQFVSISLEKSIEQSQNLAEQPIDSQQADESIMQKIFSAVAKIISEPAASKDKQGAFNKYLIRDFLGFIAHPIKGTFDLVSFKPGSLSSQKPTYVDYNRLIKKTQKEDLINNSPLGSTSVFKFFKPEDHVILGKEDKNTIIYLSKKHLKKQILNTQVLNAISEFSEQLSGDSDLQKKLQIVVKRQREYMRSQSQQISASKDKLQVKTITEDLLKQFNEQFKNGSNEDDLLTKSDSENSSLADERDIQQNLKKISRIIEQSVPYQQQIKRQQSQINEKDLMQSVIKDEAYFDKDVQMYYIKIQEYNSQNQEITDKEKQNLNKFLQDAKFLEERKETQYQQEQITSLKDMKRLERQQELLQLARQFRGFKQYDTSKDFYRHPTDASSSGGIHLKDKELIDRLRSSGKEMLKTIGKKLMSGQFNLTTVSFPIKCMCAKSTLESIGEVQGVNPIYINAAAQSKDPVERMLFVMVAAIAYFYPTHLFEKPLNPILGETFQAEGEDGTKIYVEQTEHRPPVTHFLFEGPQNLYRMHGWSSFVAKAWFNSITLKVDGKKVIEFQDGTKIEWSVPGDQFNSIFIGTIVHQVTGRIEFKYADHGLFGFIDIGRLKKQPQDQFIGEIQHNGRKLIDVSGNYMGYMDIGGVRYMDLRQIDKFYFPIHPIDSKYQLESDSLKRNDSVWLKRGDVKGAQKQKEDMEVEQRHDRKLREAVESKRKKKHLKFTSKKLKL